jgi:hypothetical protein
VGADNHMKISFTLSAKVDTQSSEINIQIWFFGLVTDSISGTEMNPTRPLLFKRGGRNVQVYKEDSRKWYRGEAFSSGM